MSQKHELDSVALNGFAILDCATIKVVAEWISQERAFELLQDSELYMLQVWNGRQWEAILGDD